MSDRDKPVNPFGRGERTIIRPNPGGRLPQAPVPSPSGEQQPSAAGRSRPVLAKPPSRQSRIPARPATGGAGGYASLAVRRGSHQPRA